MMEKMTDPYRSTDHPEWTPTLTDFLLARIAEDGADNGCYGEGEYETCWRRSDRIKRECEAKRRIVDEHSDGQGSEKFMEPFCSTCSEDGRLVYLPCPTLRILAAVYADHQDYREEWKP